MSAIISRENYDPSRLLDKIQVLIINQSMEVAALLQNILAAMGFKHSYRAEDAVGAIRYLKEMRIHVVIVDSELRLTNPQFATKEQAGASMSGAEFVRSLRQSRTSPSPYVSVVILAQEMNEEEFSRARDSGVNGVVLRPLEAAQLSQALREIVEHPRRFVVSQTYKGPCRRRRQLPLAMPDRRRRDLCIVKSN